MAETVSYDLITVGSDYITVDSIIWKRYRVRAPGILERTLEANPHLAKLHAVSPFLPVGTQVRVPIDIDILKRRPKPRITTLLWGRVK